MAILKRLGSFVLAAVALWLSPASQAAEPSLEYAVKAAYLYKFTPFVEWPAQALGAPASPFTICVVGEDPFGAALDEAVKGRRVADRPVVVVRAATADKAAGCQVLFAGRSKIQKVADIVSAMAGQPVLTVADDDGAADGAMIRFVIQGGRVRFAIDEPRAAASGLTISSKLLSLALPTRKTG